MAATGDESAKRARLGDDRGTDAERLGVVGVPLPEGELEDQEVGEGDGGGEPGLSALPGAAAEDL